MGCINKNLKDNQRLIQDFSETRVNQLFDEYFQDENPSYGEFISNPNVKEALGIIPISKVKSEIGKAFGKEISSRELKILKKSISNINDKLLGHSYKLFNIKQKGESDNYSWGLRKINSNINIQAKIDRLKQRINTGKQIRNLEDNQFNFPDINQTIKSNTTNSNKVELFNQQTLYQKQTQSQEGLIASEKTIRDLAARMSDRIGIPIKFESDRSKQYKGKLENGVAVINLAYATLDTAIHEILGHPIIRAIKYSKNIGGTITLKGLDTSTKKQELSQLYQNLLKELEYGKGKEVLDRIKRDYQYKYNVEKTDSEYGDYKIKSSESGARYFDTYEEATAALDKYGIKYTLEEQQEEAIVELVSLMTAEKLDKVKDGKLISLLKRLLKEMKQFVRSLLNLKEVEIDKLPDNMTINDLADLLAYSNSKLILPGYEVEYTTPDNEKFKTYQEASNHISELAKSIEDVDLSDVSINDIKIDKNNLPSDFKNYYTSSRAEIAFMKDSRYNDEYNNKIQELKDKYVGKFIVVEKSDYWSLSNTTENQNFYNTKEEADNAALDKSIEQYKKEKAINGFIEKNKEFEQSKEIIEEWKKVNNIQYNPEEIYSRGQEFVSVVGAYSNFDVNLMMQNLLSHIEDNQKAGGKFAISAYTKPVDKTIGHLEGGGGKIKFKLYPKSEDILWAANTDVFSGSVWDASEKVNKDKKSELLGVSYTKYPSLRNVNAVQPNLAAIVDDLSHHHNELAISLNFSNFELEVDDDVPYQTKKIISSINKILDQKRNGKLVKPEIKNKIGKKVYTAIGEFNQEIGNSIVKEFNTKEEAEIWIAKEKDNYEEQMGTPLELSSYVQQGIQPKITNETLKESIENVRNKLETKDDIYGLKLNYNNGYYFNAFIDRNSKNATEIWLADKIDNQPKHKTVEEANEWKKEFLNEFKNKFKKEYTSQALINTKVAALKEVAKKYPRSLIRSEVKRIENYENYVNVSGTKGLFDPDELPFQKIPNYLSKEQSDAIDNVFDENPELANEVYEALGFKTESSSNTITRDIKEELPFKVIGNYNEIDEGLIGRKFYEEKIGNDLYRFEISNYSYPNEDSSSESFYDIDFTVNGSEEVIGTGFFDKAERAKQILQALLSQNFGNDTVRFNVEESKKGKQRLSLYKRLMNQLGYNPSGEMEYALFYNTNTFLSPSDKIIFGHPTIGKSFLKNQGEDKFITLDDDYANEVNSFIDANKGSETRQEYKGRKPKEYNDFMLNLYDKLKIQAKKEGKILFVSNTNILKERMSDFDKVITMPKDEFKKRFDARGATYGFEDWKSDIDATVAKVPTNKIINTTGYLSDLFKPSNEIGKINLTPQQKQQAQQRYSQYLDTIFPDSKVKDIVYHGSPNKHDIFKTIDENAREERFKHTGAMFTSDKNYTNAFGENLYNVVLNIKNPEILSNNTGINSTFVATQYYSEWKNKGKDGVIGHDALLDLDHISNGTEYVVFEPEQIHILGSKQDIEGFKEFVRNKTKGDYETKINKKALNESTDSDIFHYPFDEVYDELDQSEPTGEFEDTFDSEFETNSKKLDKIILNRYLKIQKSLERQKDKLVSEFNKIENTNDFTKDAEIYFDKHKELISEINIVEEKLKRIKAVVDAIFDKKDITSVVIAESNLIIDDINKLLKSENISPAELDYYYNLTKLLEEIHDENLKQEDSSLFTSASSEDLNQLKKLKNTFSNLNNDLLELLRKNINIKNDPIKDAKLFSQWFLKVGDYTNDILKKAESMISKSLFNITKFLNKELEAIKELHLKADSDFKRTGKQNNKFDIFFDKNKRIVQVFNYEYTDAAAKLYNAFRFASKDSAKSKRLELIRFHKQHSILLNAKYLFPDIYEHLTGTKVSAEEINKNIALYKSYLDDYTFEKMKSKVYKQTIKYLSKRDNDFFMSNMPFDENSLIQEFLTYIPKDKSNYNDKYSKIVQNDNLRNVYDKFMDLFNELKLISQGTTRSNLNKGFLPFLEKTMIENLSDFSFSTELGKFKQSILSSYDQLKNNSGQTVSNQVENPLKTVNDGLRSFLETKANDYYKQEKINLIYFLTHKKLTTNSAKLITEKFGPGFPSKKAEEIIESWTKEYFTNLEDSQTNDIQVLMNLMAQTVTSYKQKQAIESNLNLIKIAFDNQAVGEFDILGNLVGTNPTKKGRETKLAELLEVTINHFFGKNVQKPQLNDFLKRINNVSVAKQEELNKLVKEINENKELTPNEKIELEKALQNKFKKDSKYVDLDKINDKLLQYLRVLFLGWSPKSAFFNAAMGHIGNYMETIDGRIVDSKDLSAGVKMLFGKEKKKIQKLIANLSLIEDITKDFKKTTEESLHNEKWKNFKPERLQQIVEKSNQSPLIAALLNKSFNGVRIIDMIDESGNFLPQYEEYEYKFVNTAKYLIEKVHGPYDSNRIIMAETTSLGKNVIFMKKWMITSFFMKRFGSFDEKPREDLLMDYQFKGTYITLADVFNTMSNDQSGQRNYLLGIMKTMKAIALSDQSLTEVDKANLRSVRADLLIIGALLIAQQLVKYMLSDDDDDHEGLVFLLNTFFRIETELGSHYFLIDTFEGLAKNTIPQLDVYNRLEKIIKSFDENARISPAIRLAQMVPVLNSGVSLYNFFNQQILYNR